MQVHLVQLTPINYNIMQTHPLVDFPKIACLLLKAEKTGVTTREVG